MKLWRRVLATLNFAGVVVLLGVLFIMVNYLASRRYARWDLTRTQITKLSDQTLQTLKSLKEPLSVTVFYQPTHRLYELLRDELSEYERATPKLKIEYVDPEQDVARARQLSKTLEIQNPNVVVFQSGPAGGGAGNRRKYVSDAELADYDLAVGPVSTQPPIKAFKGEEAFTSAILSVTQERSQLIWFTTGHGEKAVDSTEQLGFSSLKRALEQQNMTVRPVTLLTQSAIPPDVKLIIIAGPTHRFSESEVTLLNTYAAHGGRLLLLMDPLEDAGLDEFLGRWGIALGMDIVVDPSHQLPFVSASNLLVTTYTRHPIVEKMQTLVTLFPLARSVSPVKPAPSGLTTTPLALTSKEGWGETDTSSQNFDYTAGKDLKGPVSIAVAAERTLSGTGGNAGRARAVVIGDSDFAINAQLDNVGNRDFLMGAVYWLLDQERLIGIGPKTLESVKLHLTDASAASLFWFSLFALPLGLAALGAAMWWLRRR